MIRVWLRSRAHSPNHIFSPLAFPMAVEDVVGADSTDNIPSITTSNYLDFYDKESGQRPAHSKHKRSSMEIWRRDDPDFCKVNLFDPSCTAISKGLPKFHTPPHKGGSSSETEPTAWSSISIGGILPPITRTSRPPFRSGSSTTLLSSTSQNSPIPTSQTDSLSQSTTAGVNIDSPSEKPSASTSGFSSDGGANTSRPTTPDGLSIVISTSTVVLSANYPPPPSDTILSSLPDSSSNSHQQLSTGAIVGITITVISAVLCVVLVLFLLLRRMSRRTRRMSNESGRQPLQPSLYDGTF